MIWILIIATLLIGGAWGFILALVLAQTSRADDHDPMEYTPEQRIMPRIWDGFNGKERT